MAKKKRPAGGNEPAGAEEEPAFEECLQELQEIVGRLEAGTLGLEESMQQFEKGVQLLRSCYRVLEHAEQKIEILTGMDAQGNPRLAPFDASATAARQDKSAGRRRSTPTLLDEDDGDDGE